MDRAELERAAARMVWVGFDGHAPTDAVRRLIRRGVGGVILFARNVASPSQVAALVAELKREAPGPLCIAVDQEGGRVIRLREGFSSVPPMRALGRTGDEALAQRVGQLLARELRAVGIDIDLAPVLDVDSNPANPVIGDRSLGPSPDLVSRLGCAILRGLQAGGVAACGKHFPGHGDTAQDSHHDLPRLSHAMARLEAVELPPFEAAVRAGVAMIMTSHVLFEPLDATYPATMSRPALDGLLRDRMGFNGVVISDDLEMKAIAAHFPLEEVLVRGAGAGVDAFAICHDAAKQERAIDVLVQAAQRGEIAPARIAEAGRRLAALADAYARPATGVVADGVLACTEHRAVVEEVLARSAAAAASQARGPDPTDFRR